MEGHATQINKKGGQKKKWHKNAKDKFKQGYDKSESSSNEVVEMLNLKVNQRTLIRRRCNAKIVRSLVSLLMNVVMEKANKRKKVKVMHLLHKKMTQIHIHFF